MAPLLCAESPIHSFIKRQATTIMIYLMTSTYLFSGENPLNMKEGKPKMMWNLVVVGGIFLLLSRQYIFKLGDYFGKHLDLFLSVVY